MERDSQGIPAPQASRAFPFAMSPATWVVALAREGERTNQQEMHMKMNVLKIAVGLALATLGSIGMNSVANASAMLVIQNFGVSPAPLTPGFHADVPTGQWEVIGDPGGTFYSGGTVAGAGIPTVLGNWPGTLATVPGFATDPTFNDPSGAPAIGTSGWHTAYLYLTEAADVTFQYMGGGDSTQPNEFWVNGASMFTDGIVACSVIGTTPSCTPGQNQFTIPLAAGPVPFAYRIDTSGVFLDNTVAGGNPDPHTGDQPGYFLGVDPYLATGQFDTFGRAVYAGLTDLPGATDHDFQDLGVRISVPEPGTLLLLSGGLIGLGAFRRRKA